MLGGGNAENQFGLGWAAEYFADLLAPDKAVKAPLRIYCPHAPHPKQSAFLALDVKEALFGGAAGGGKSDALLMAALQHVDVPNYAALLLRRTYPDLIKPGALMDRADQWLRPTAARWSEKRRAWIFPSGAIIAFGHLDHENHKYEYQSSEFQFVGFDELTQFTETQYRYLFSRLRRLKGSRVPIRMRAATNPGGVGHEWVKMRFALWEDDTEKRNDLLAAHGRAFVRSMLEDNPSLDREEYEESLAELDPVTRAQLRGGDWSAAAAGNKFKREWFEIVDAVPAACRWVRFWDLAATDPKPGTDPDYTAGCLMGMLSGVFYIKDMRRTRSSPSGVEQLIKQTAELDGRAVAIRMEQEPGSSGVNTIDHYRRTILPGFDFNGLKSTGSKEVRANPLSSAAEAKNVKLLRGAWIPAFLDEAEMFPHGAHDDMEDAASGAHLCLTSGPRTSVQRLSV